MKIPMMKILIPGWDLPPPHSVPFALCPSPPARGEKSLSSTQQVSAAASSDVVRPRLAT